MDTRSRALADADDVHGQGEAIQQLRAELTFFRIHRPDENEAGRVGKGDAFTLDHVHAHGGRVQQHIHHVVVEQIDFVDVEQTAVGAGQHARLEVTFAFLDGLFDVERSHHAVFGGGNGQVHKGGGADMMGNFGCAAEAFLAFGAPGVRLVGVAAKAAIIDDFHFGEQGGQCTRRSGFCCAAFAADQHTADACVNGIQDERTSHALLSYNCSKWKNRWHLSQLRIVIITRERRLRR